MQSHRNVSAMAPRIFGAWWTGSQDVSDPLGRARGRRRVPGMGSLTSWLRIDEQNPGRHKAPPDASDACDARVCKINSTCQ